MNISELAKDWSGENGRDNFKKAKDQAPSWEDYQAVIKELRAEAKVARAKLKEANAHYNDINDTIAVAVFNDSLNDGMKERLKTMRKEAYNLAQQKHRELYWIKEAIKIAKKSW